MLTLPLSLLAKYILAAIITILIAINGYNWDEQYQQKLQQKLQATHTQQLEHILKYPEQIKGCKL